MTAFEHKSSAYPIEWVVNIVEPDCAFLIVSTMANLEDGSSPVEH